MKNCLTSKCKENAELIGFLSIVNNRPGKMNNQPGEIPNKLLKSDIVIDTIWLSREIKNVCKTYCFTLFSSSLKCIVHICKRYH